MEIEEPTEEPLEVWEINRCKPEYIQMYSICLKTNTVLAYDHVNIYFNKLKYSSEYGGELWLYLDKLTIARIGMEGKTVVLGEGVNFLELLNQYQQEKQRD